MSFVGESGSISKAIAGSEANPGDYVALLKPRVMSLVIFTAVAGLLLAPHGVNPVIGSVSLGAERDFVLRHKETRAKRTITLGHGSLLVMGGTCQHRWLHGVPRTKKALGPRVNLTFRAILLS